MWFKVNSWPKNNFCSSEKWCEKLCTFLWLFMCFLLRKSMYSRQDSRSYDYSFFIVNLYCCNLVNCQYKCTLAIISMCFLFVWYKEQYPLSVTASVIDQFNYLPITITQTNSQQPSPAFRALLQCLFPANTTQHNCLFSSRREAEQALLYKSILNKKEYWEIVGKRLSIQITNKEY